MNRQQRRANSKPQRVISKSATWWQIQAKLHCHSNAPSSQEANASILMPLYASITRLTSGIADQSDFYLINEMNCFGFNLAGDISKNGDDETRQAVAGGYYAFMATSDALTRIGNRKNASGKWGASGDDLQALRDMAHWVDELMQVSTEGLIMSALMGAKVQTEKSALAAGWIMKGIE